MYLYEQQRNEQPTRRGRKERRPSRKERQRRGPLLRNKKGPGQNKPKQNTTVKTVKARPQSTAPQGHNEGIRPKQTEQKSQLKGQGPTHLTPRPVYISVSPFIQPLPPFSPTTASRIIQTIPIPTLPGTGMHHSLQTHRLHVSHLCRSSHKNAVASNSFASLARTLGSDSTTESLLNAGVGSNSGPGPEESFFDAKPTWVCDPEGDE